LFTGVSITAGPLQGTIDGALLNQTPSQAEHGLGGAFYFGSAFEETLTVAETIWLTATLDAVIQPQRSRAGGEEGKP